MITFLKYFHNSFRANSFTRYIVSISPGYYYWPFPRKVQILSAGSPRVRCPARGPGVSARVVAVTEHVGLTGHVSTRASVLAADTGTLIGQTAPANHHVSLAAQLKVTGLLKISCVCFVFIRESCVISICLVTRLAASFWFIQEVSKER